MLARAAASRAAAGRAVSRSARLAGAAPRPASSSAAAAAAASPAGQWRPPHVRRGERYAKTAETRAPAEVLADFEAFADAAPEAWVRAWNGSRVGIVQLSREVFAREPRADVLLRVVEWQRQKNRQLTGFTLGRGEVAGSGKKPFKQKGTGNARRGTLKSAPILRGGGKAHGPVQRSTEQDLPKKVRRLGLQMALSAKAAEGNLVVFDKAWLPVHQTAYLKEVLARNGLDQGRTLVIDGDQGFDPNFELAAGNLAPVCLRPARGANVMEVLKHTNLVVTLSGLRALEQRLGGDAELRAPYEWEEVRDEDSQLVGAFADKAAAARAAAADEAA